MMRGTRRGSSEIRSDAVSPRSSSRPVLHPFLYILLSLCIFVPAAASGQPGTPGRAPQGRGGQARLAPDLIEAAKRHAPQDMVGVILNLNGSNNNDQAMVALIASMGGVIRGSYHRVGQIVADIPAGAVEQLTQVQGLDYVAPDRPVTGLVSHIQTTTGASQVYRGESSEWGSFQRRAPMSGFNGIGVAVAVIDSGVNPDETDLREGGRRRTLLSMDFTGSGSSGDPYGPGTHVAGIIAGNGAASVKAGFDFSGIAPGANLVSFRVLDDHGRGYLSNVIAAIDLAITTSSYYNIKVVNLSLAAPPVESFR